MARTVGCVSRGIRAPIIRKGDNLPAIVVDSVLAASGEEGFALRDRDVVGITEAVVARSQGNYATVDQIAADVRTKFGEETVGLVFPILSRNRFAICLRGIARGAKKMVLLFSYPSDEVGNQLISLDQLDASGVDPYTDVLTEAQYRAKFGENVHPFTKVDYVAYYKQLVQQEGTEVEIHFGNDPKAILQHTKFVIAADIHSRKRTKRILLDAGARQVLGLDNLLTAPVEGSGYNEKYGLLGSNKATEDSVKLFPRECGAFVQEVQRRLIDATGKHIEVMIYGDGAFKDPVGKIWELADPVVSPGFTAGLMGLPSELKLKYLADNELANLSGEELTTAMKQRIAQKDADLMGRMESEGTTPRHLTDLLGSLCDLTTGSGDKGTPIVLIQGYFDNYATGT